MMNSWTTGPLQGLFFVRDLQSSDNNLTTALMDPVDLIPFDVTLALAGTMPVDTATLTVVVSRWLADNFEESVAELGYRHKFRNVALRELVLGIREQSSYSITYEGRSYWSTSFVVPTETEVGAMQLNGLANTQGLMNRLQEVSDETGLGSAVVDARGELNRGASSTKPPVQSNSTSFDGIIIAAIIIAILASVLLAFALFMAWRSGRSEKESYVEGTDLDGDATRGITPPQDVYRRNGPISDNVISDDISSSLSAYYKQGMTGGYRSNRDQAGHLNDAASVSSMESYGYSLDGYASSITNI